MQKDDSFSDASSLQASIKTTFPDADIQGLRLVNGKPTRAILSVTNAEKKAIQVAFVAGALVDPSMTPGEDTPHWKAILANLTTTQYSAAVQPGETRELPYAFAVDLLPKDVRIEIMAVVTTAEGELYQVPAYNGVAALVDPATNLLDPQM